MFSSWFVIRNNCLYDEDYLHGTQWSSCGNLWGMKLGGRWCLDYYFKLCFGLSTEYWKTKCDDLRTNEDLYDLFDDLGIAYKRYEDREIIHWKGELYDEKEI